VREVRDASALEVLPAALRERLARLHGPDELAGLAAAWSRPRPTTVRVHPLRASPSSVARALASDGLVATPVAWCPGALVVERPGACQRESLRALQATRAYAEGHVYVQGLASMVAVFALEPRPGEAVLDLCAAPGGKTTQIHGLMRGRGTLHANDRSRARVHKLRAVLAAQGCEDVRLSVRPGAAFGRTHAGTFDRVLVDAPCSMEGRIDLSDPRTWRDWTPGKVRRLAREQESLLRAAIRATRPGGVVVYSTCTLAPEENERVVDRVVRRARGEVAIAPIALEVPGRRAGLPRWNERAFDPAIARTMRLPPGVLLEGFFVARLRRRP